MLQPPSQLLGVWPPMHVPTDRESGTEEQNRKTERKKEKERKLRKKLQLPRGNHLGSREAKFELSLCTDRLDGLQE